MFPGEMMAYHTGFGRAAGRGAPLRGLGDFWQDVQTVINAAPTAIAVIKDPAFPELVATIDRISVQTKIDHAGEPPDTSPGVGLANVIPYVKFYAWLIENKWAVPLLGLAAIGIPVALGVFIGRWTAE